MLQRTMDDWSWTIVVGERGAFPPQCTPLSGPSAFGASYIQLLRALSGTWWDSFWVVPYSTVLIILPNSAQPRCLAWVPLRTPRNQEALNSKASLMSLVWKSNYRGGCSKPQPDTSKDDWLYLTVTPMGARKQRPRLQHHTRELRNWK